MFSLLSSFKRGTLDENETEKSKDSNKRFQSRFHQKIPRRLIYCQASNEELDENETKKSKEDSNRME